MIRKLCEKYTGTTPADYEHLTFDQIYLMVAPIGELTGRRTISVEQATSRGLVQGGPSLAMQAKMAREKRQRQQERRERREKRRARKAQGGS